MPNLISLLVILFAVRQVVTEPSPIITNFETNPGILFENLGNTHLHSSEWNLVVFYNLTSYSVELEGIHGCISKLKQLCIPLRKIDPNNQNCEIMITQLDPHLTEITNLNDALFPSIPYRTKRSFFDAGGNILHYAFGVLDQNSADLYDSKIEKLQLDQNYLLELVKNQTLIIDTSSHIIKHTEETLNHQFDLFQQHLNEIDTDANWEKVRAVLNRNLNSLSVYTTLLLMRFKDTQKALLDASTNTRLHSINPLILSPKLMLEQLQFIQNNLPNHLTLPKINNKIDTKTIFSMTTIKSRLNKHKLILELQLPLTLVETFQMFKLIPVPTKIDTHYAYINPSQNYLIANLDRDRYTTLNSDDFNKCLLSSENTYICKPQYPLYTGRSKQHLCEIELLIHPQTIPSSCQLSLTDKRKFWIPMFSNKYIFVVDRTTTIDLICELEVTQLKLSGSGTISIENGCHIRDGDTLIFPKIFRNSSVHTSFLPSVNISIHQSQILPLKKKQYTDNPTIPSDPITVDFLNNLIENQKRAEKALPSSLNAHDVNHYVSNSVLFLFFSILLIAFIAHYKGFSVTKWCYKSKTHQITPLETVYSIPTSTRTTNNIQPAPRSTLPE